MRVDHQSQSKQLHRDAGQGEQEERAAQARMTGSGACVFAEFANETEARAIQSQMPRGMDGFVALSQDRAEINQGQSRGPMDAKVRPLLRVTGTDTKATNPATARQIDFSDLV